MATLTREANRKRKSGRRLAMEALMSTEACSRCKSRVNTVTRAVPTKNGTKWLTHCQGEKCKAWITRKLNFKEED